MSWFWPKTPEKPQVAEPEPFDRLQALHERVRVLKGELDEHDGTMRQFKTRYRVRTDRFGRLLGCELPGFSDYAGVAAQWRILLRRRDSLVTAWHSALAQWSQEKERASLEVASV